MATPPLPDFSEQRLSGDVVHRGDIITVERDRVRLPNGHDATRDVVRHPGAAAIIPLLNKDTVLLEWQYRHPLRRHLWEIPAGKIDAGEDPLATAKRELLEETGYRGDNWAFVLTMASAVGFCDEQLHIFLATDLHHEGGADIADEFLHLQPTPVQQARRMIASGDITDAKTIIALLWLGERHNAK